MSNPLAFPPPVTTYSAGAISPFDVAGITAAIDRAASSLKPEERGALTVPGIRPISTLRG